ncbi:hypothetical protein CPC08DRAFT_711311 [Agrocybe pediades]|nr:hypothetical protein CPC08DRAFT_711311 [Agrocybe pediades]
MNAVAALDELTLNEQGTTTDIPTSGDLITSTDVPTSSQAPAAAKVGDAMAIGDETVAQDAPNTTGSTKVEVSNPESAPEVSKNDVPPTPVNFGTHRRQISRNNSWNFIWQSNAADSPGDEEKSKPVNTTPPMSTPTAHEWGKRRESVVERPKLNASRSNTNPATQDLELREQILERRERELDRKEREYDRRERELERRERELERRQREYERDRARWTSEAQVVPDVSWHKPFEALKHEIALNFTAERKRLIDREEQLETKIMNKVNSVLEQERQLYGVMKMSDHEVKEMMESSVGYLLQSDEEIADRVRFQSLLYLSQERLASEAGLPPPPGSDSLSLAWRLALGPSVVTEDRYKKALELLGDKELDESTKRLLENKKAVEYAVEYTSHLRREGSETSEYSFSLGRIPREDYMESVQRHSAEGSVEYEALKALVDFISPAA